jgi:hypothetical protein
VFRAALLLALLTAYAAATIRPVLHTGGRGFDALAPEARFVERAIGERRFDEARPVALELQRAYPGEPLIVYWLTVIDQGLGYPAD